MWAEQSCSKRATGAPILLNQNDLPLLDMMEMQASWLGTKPPEVSAPDIDARDGLTIGVTNLAGEVLATPGHTEGSICLYFAPQALLIAGDTLFAGSIGRTDLPGGDGERILRSIHDRLLPLPDTTIVVPGHGGLTTIQKERNGNPFLIGLA